MGSCCRHDDHATEHPRGNTDDKRLRVTGGGGKKHPCLLIAAILAILALGAAAFLFTRGDGGPAPMDHAAMSSPGDPATIALDAAAFDDGEARFYDHAVAGGKNVRFFVVKSGDGVIRAAFDACDVCWASRKGYRQEGNVMVCNNCAQTFAVDRINEEEGGCNPSPLPRRVESGKVIIEASAIAEGARYF